MKTEEKIELLDNPKILKQITIISECRHYGEFELGHIIYTRPSTPESDYRIDNVILDAVVKKYPKSKVKDETIFHAGDLEKISALKKGCKIKSTIRFSPNSTSICECKGKPIKDISINIYTSENPKKFKKEIFFEAQYNAIDSEVLEELKAVNFE